MVKVTDRNYYMNEWLKANLDILKKALYDDYDCFLVVSGRERFGKSTLAGQIAYYLDPTYNIDRCVFTPDQFHGAVDNAKKYQAIVFDEAHGSLNSKESMSSVNRKLTQTFTEMGFKNLIVILVLPSFFELGKYPAIHRSNLLLHVYKRGSFLAFNYKKKKKIHLFGKRGYVISEKANFMGDFTKFFPLEKKEYDKKKLESTSTPKNVLTKKEIRWIEQRNLLIDCLANEYGVKNIDISRKIGVRDAVISKILKRNGQNLLPSDTILLGYDNNKVGYPSQ